GEHGGDPVGLSAPDESPPGGRAEDIERRGVRGGHWIVLRDGTRFLEGTDRVPASFPSRAVGERGTLRTYVRSSRERTGGEEASRSTEEFTTIEDGPASWVEGLNRAQRDAVMHGDGPLLVAAGAGTGKTWTIACRVARLLESGVPPDRILLLTFTRRAAREMLARARRLTGRTSAGRVWGGTFHAIANRRLRRFGAPIGVRPDFTVLDQADAADLMNLIRSDLGLAARTRRVPRKDPLPAIYSRMVNAGVPLGRVLSDSFPWCADEAEAIASIFRAYTERKRSQNVLDFDDLLLFWRAMATSPDMGPRVAGSFDHILVDEYQDTNDLQAQILG